MSGRKKKRLLALGALLLLLAGFAPWPVAKLSQADQVFAVRNALAALKDPTCRVIWYRADRRWWQDIHYQSLPDAHFAAAHPFRYINELPFADVCFAEAGMVPISPQEEAAWNPDNGLSFIRISSRLEHQNESGAERSNGIFLTYGFGSLGGQGLAIEVWRSVFLRYAIYKHLWVS